MIAVCNQRSCGGSRLALHPLCFTFCYPHSLFLCKQPKSAEMQLDRLGLQMKTRRSKPKSAFKCKYLFTKITNFQDERQLFSLVASQYHLSTLSSHDDRSTGVHAAWLLLRLTHALSSHIVYSVKIFPNRS